MIQPVSRFSSLTVTAHVQGQLYACTCSCGKILPKVLAGALTSGLIKDCGCITVGGRPNWGKYRLKTRCKDLTSQSFGQWTVLSCSGKHNDHPKGQTVWRCKCSCGKIKDRVLYGSLTSGKSLSCGHDRNMRVGGLRRAHGLYLSHRAHYSIWKSLKTRCYNRNHPTYARYGAVGVQMEPAWVKSFEQFVRDVGPRFSNGWRLARINEGLGYTRSNVRWVNKSKKD